jgi:hypothetical protein
VIVRLFLLAAFIPLVALLLVQAAVNRAINWAVWGTR